jgi:nucleoside-diphosphate-sugar epimerase
LSDCSRVLVTGATGFTGPFVVRALLERGHRVGAFVLENSGEDALRELGIDIHVGDLSRPETLGAALEGYDALANVASLGFGHAEGIVSAVAAAGVRRAVFVSTTAIFTNLNAPSKSVRMAAEDAVRSGIDQWTILRPTMIYGTPGDRNISRLVRHLRRWRVIVVPGPGTNLIQPIHVEDVAFAIAEAVGRPEAAGKAYDISGAEPVTFNHLIDSVGRLLERRVLRLHIPLFLARAIARLTRPLLGRRGVSAEQVMRLNEDKAFSHEDAARDLGLAPRSIESGLRGLLSLLEPAS